jgi:hypothetical protein
MATRRLCDSRSLAVRRVSRHARQRDLPSIFYVFLCHRFGFVAPARVFGPARREALAARYNTRMNETPTKRRWFRSTALNLIDLIDFDGNHGRMVYGR